MTTYKHIVICNAGPTTPIGGDMCICLRLLRESIPEPKMNILSPKDCLEAAKDLHKIPQPILDAVNELLTEEIDKTGYVKLYQEQVMKKIKKFTNGEYTSSQVYDNHWMDFEDHYRSQGWEVEFYKTPYYSQDDSYFVFQIPRKMTFQIKD